MPINYKKTVAVLEGHCEIEEAENLLAWLLENPQGKLNLKQLGHPHTALVQVMMAIRPQVSVFPEDENVSVWLQPLLKGET